MRFKKNWFEGADAALRRAAKKARELSERTGTPLWVMKDGKIVDLLASKRKPRRGKRA